MNRRPLLAVAAIFSIFSLLAVTWLAGQQPAGKKEEAKPAEAKENAGELAAKKAAALEKDVTQGALRIVGADAAVVECPLKHTDVSAEVTGFVARVKVVQTFQNPSKEKIEAVYVFPLPHESAIDDVTMTIGDRKIVGQIKRRAEARTIYEQALQSGQTAALLEQERPNIFTQSVGNIEPGQEIKIEISYVDVLKYDLGTYEFQFPMVVGPRYNPGAPLSSPSARPKELEGKVSPPAADTTKVPDGSKISPPVLKPGVRNGHDISLTLNLDAGVPIQKIKVANHEADIKQPGVNKASVKLSDADSLPNKDFVLRYSVLGKQPEMALLTHTGSYTDTRRLGSGYFMLMIQPKEDERLQKSPPREIVFLVDVSGSMSGEPTKKCISAMQNMLKLCREQDTLQVITFASQADQLFEKSVPVNEANIKRALNFTEGLKGGGGTEMLKGVKLAIDAPVDKERVRIIVMLTDGYIGNEAEIIEHVGKNCGDQVRFWAIGIGSSPNMFLIDGVAKQGGGMGKRLDLTEDPVPLTQEVISRIQRAQLSKVRIDWGGLPIAETFPAKLPELWAGRPVIMYGRFGAVGDALRGVPGTINVRGSIEGEEVSWPLKVSLPEKEPGHDVLAKIWARQKIEDLMQQSFYQGSPAVEEEVTALALDYRLMSQYTSFVAVDAKDTGKSLEPATPPRRMLVPVPLPEGTQWEGFFGGDGEGKALKDMAPVARFKGLGRGVVSEKSKMAAGFMPASPKPLGGRGGGGGGGGTLAPIAASSRPARLSLMKATDKLERLSDSRTSGDRLARIRGPQLRQLQESRKMPIERSLTSRLSAKSGEARYAFSYARVQDGEIDGLALGDSAFTAQAISATVEPLYKAAQEAFKAGNTALETKDLAVARIAFLRACFLDTAAANLGHGDGETAAAALEALVEIHDLETAAWTKEQPALAKRLDLVLRDNSLTEALTEIGTAAGVEIKLVPGSAEDSVELLGQTPRISYLDLRRATVTEALDWLLQPARLSWRLEKEKLVVGSDRRLAGDSAWVYDVAAISLPSSEELSKLGDHNKAVEAAKKCAAEFLTAVRADLKAKDETSVCWFAPGQLLVIGNADSQAAAGKLLQALATSDFKPGSEIAKLYETTKKRFAERKDKLAKLKAARELSAVADAHEEFGWQLLAAALAGKVDDEALTELTIAWKQPQTAELLKGEGAAIALRSLFAIQESARRLSAENAAEPVGNALRGVPERHGGRSLQDLAASARKQSSDAIAASLAALEKQPGDVSALASVLYAALALPDDAALVSKARSLLVQPVKGSASAARSTLALALLEKPDAIDREALAKLVAEGVQGDDLVILTALACRRAGGDTWNAFRAQSHTLLGEQPLSGSVVVFVNRL